MKLAHWCCLDHGVDHLPLECAHNLYIVAFIKFLFQIRCEFNFKIIYEPMHREDLTLQRFVEYVDFFSNIWLGCD